MCMPIETLRSTACRHFVQAGRTGWQHPHTLPSLDVGCEGVMAFFWAELGFLVHVQNGDLIEITDAEIQEALYAQPPCMHRLLHVLFSTPEQSLQPGCHSRITWGDGSITVSLGITRPHCKCFLRCHSHLRYCSLGGAPIWLRPPQQALHRSLPLTEAKPCVLSPWLPATLPLSKEKVPSKGNDFFFTNT